MIFLYKARDIVIYFSLKYLGDWEEIYRGIKNKESIDDDLFKTLLSKCDFRIVTILDEDYPDVLKSIYHPPFALFCLGNIELLNKLRIATVVGSRNSSSYGLDACKHICKELVKENYTILSGMARGIDTIAHQTALENKGKSIAVLGCGINYCYPKENKDLYDVLKRTELVISEYPFATLPNKVNFPVRNRILAAIGNFVVVPELKIQSGTFSTITHALNSGKDVYAIPHPILDGTYNNQLIKEGALVIESVRDILE